MLTATRARCITQRARPLLYARNASKTPVFQPPSVQKADPATIARVADQHIQKLKEQVKHAKPTTLNKDSEYFDTTNLQWYTPRMLNRNYKRPRPPTNPFPLDKKPGPPAYEARQTDIFHQLGINPVKEVNNSLLLSGFVTSMGKIKTRQATGLTQRSQRLMGKAIRRARHMGIIPWMSKSRAY